MRNTLALPILALSDRSLRARDLRVFAAICYFDHKKTGVSTATRKAIADLARVPEVQVSRSTTALLAAGWLTERIGNGGRQRPSTYGVNWHHTPAENGDQLEHGLGGANGAQLEHGLGGVNGAQLEHGLGVNGAQLEHGLGVNGAQLEHGLEAETVLKSSTPYQINNINITNTDQIRSDRGSSSSSFGVADAIIILQSFGMPPSYVKKDEDRGIVVSWINNGVGKAKLTAACERAKASKKDGKPFGPRYIDMVLSTIAREEDNKGGKGKQDGAGESFADKQYDETL